MRVVIVAPWFRSLAHIHGWLLHEAGHDVLVVTTDRHPEHPPPTVTEVVVQKPGFPRSVLKLASLRSLVGRFDPQVILEDVVDDPIWLLVAPRSVPRILLIHDAIPHDQANAKGVLRNQIGLLQAQRARRIGVFSSFVEQQLLRDGFRGHDIDGTIISRLPLMSDLLPSVDPIVYEGPRRNFALFGRLSHYKGADIAIRSWQEIVDSGFFPGEYFYIWGASESIDKDRLPPRMQVASGRFSYRDLIPKLQSCRAAVLPYRAASQSGVQVLCHQIGLPTIVSSVGALPEYQPIVPAPIPPGDGQALVASMRQFADESYQSLCIASALEANSQRTAASVGRSFRQLIASV